MSSIKITWFGHSCFKVEYQDKSAVFDPYQDGSVPGLTLPDGITADAVYCSHEHADHNARERIYVHNSSDPFKTWTLRVPHDDVNGATRGMTDIRFIQLGSCVLAHTGDIGRLPDEKEYALLQKADILLIPAGGYYTINAAQAAEIIKRIKPSLTILMHYRNGWGYDVLADINEIHQVIPDLQETDKSCITFDEAELPHGIITMKPLQ